MYEKPTGRGRLLVFPLALCLLAGIACGGANVASTPKVVNACGYLKVGARLAEGEGGGGSCPRLGANLFNLPRHLDHLEALYRRAGVIER